MCFYNLQVYPACMQVDRAPQDDDQPKLLLNKNKAGLLIVYVANV